MRKKTVNHLADTIFWYLLYFLPVITYLIYIMCIGGTDVNIINFADFFSSIGLGIVESNVIVSTLSSIFGSSGVLPLFNTSVPFIIFGWFIGMYIIHLAVDFLLFLPRLCHKYMDKFTAKVGE